MYKIPGLPSPEDDIHEIADFAEIECIKKKDKTVSAREVISALDKLDDHRYTDGVPEVEALESRVEDAINEIEQRRKFCGVNYPFKIDEYGHVISLNPKVDKAIHEIYTFLLLATRLDMKNQRRHNQIDGALLFERLSEYVGKYYFGERAESFLFGTSSGSGNFEKKINLLIDQLREGGRFRNRNQISPDKYKDDTLDVVVWKSFSDGYQGKLIGFGQCKTGTHWKDTLKMQQPDIFCKQWFIDQPAVNPVRLFFISESILRSEWYHHTTNSGILFDRCRIMDYLPIEQIKTAQFFSQIKEWNKAVAASI
jgi:hypothetical protein